MIIILDKDVKPSTLGVAEGGSHKGISARGVDKLTRVEGIDIESKEVEPRKELGEYIANMICGIDILLESGGLVVGKVGEKEK